MFNAIIHNDQLEDLASAISVLDEAWHSHFEDELGIRLVRTLVLVHSFHQYLLCWQATPEHAESEMGEILCK